MTYYHWLGRKAEKYHTVSPAAVNAAIRAIMETIKPAQEADGFITKHPKL